MFFLVNHSTATSILIGILELYFPAVVFLIVVFLCIIGFLSKHNYDFRHSHLVPL